MLLHAVFALTVVVADVNTGAKLVAQNGCQSCHGVKFQGSAGFPPLYGIEHRRTRAQIIAALVSPTAPMPNYGFTEAQAGDVAEYLAGLDGGASQSQPIISIAPAHLVDYADVTVRFPGALPKTVTAIHHDFMGRGMDDVSFVSLEYETAHGKTWATAENDYFIPGKFREVIVCGDKLSAVCDYNVAQYKIKTYDNKHVAEGKDFKGVEGAVKQIECPPEEPLLAELRAFIDSIKTRATPRADAWSGYDAVRVLNAALESVKTGRAVTL